MCYFLLEKESNVSDAYLLSLTIMTENKNFDIALFYCNKVLDMGAKDLNIFIIKLDCLNNLKK